MHSAWVPRLFLHLFSEQSALSQTRAGCLWLRLMWVHGILPWAYLQTVLIFLQLGLPGAELKSQPLSSPLCSTAYFASKSPHFPIPTAANLSPCESQPASVLGVPSCSVPSAAEGVSTLPF
jgi:hypothetical protein